MNLGHELLWFDRVSESETTKEMAATWQARPISNNSVGSYLQKYLVLEEFCIGPNGEILET